MEIIEFAKRELERSTYDDKLKNDLLLLIAVIENQGWNYDATCANLDIIRRLISRKPLQPITGKSVEWTPVGPGLLQNKYCESVYKDTEHDIVFDTQATIFIDQLGNHFIHEDVSTEKINLPYYPPTAVVEVNENDTLVEDEKQIIEDSGRFYFCQELQEFSNKCYIHDTEFKETTEGELVCTKCMPKRKM